MIILHILLACTAAPASNGSPDPSSSETETPSDTDTEGDVHSTETDSPSPTGDTGATGPTDTVVDTSDTGIDETTDTCDSLPPLPVSYTTMAWAPPTEDFTFLEDGRILAVVGGHLQAVSWGGQLELLVPNVGDVRGTRLLADGRAALAHIDTGSVLLVDPDTGSQEVLASGLQNPNGIAIGEDGWVYVACTDRIMRADPVTQTVEVVAERANRSFDGLSFSPDYSRLYFNEEVGRVHWVDFDADGNPGPMFDGPSVPIGAFSLLDGMAVDECGNLYTTEMGSTVWRITPAGNVEKVMVVSGIAILPALNFGPGVGGFEEDVLYVADFTGKMHAVEVGVAGKSEPHLP